METKTDRVGVGPLKVAFIGTGNMGAPMAMNLISAGHDVFIPARGRSDKVLQLAAYGARVAPTARDAALMCDAVILMLPGDREVSQVVTGPDGIEDVMRPGALLIDCTTSIPSLTRDIGAKLSQRGIGMIDAPVVRGVTGAKAGTVAFFLGGPKEHIDAAMPLLEIMGDTFIRVGALGSGHTTKILNNLLSLGHLALLSEALELASHNGVMPEPFIQALMSGNARSATLEQHAKRLVSDVREDVRFRIELATKDLALAAELATIFVLPQTGSRHMWSTYQAAMKCGLSDEDITTIKELFRDGNPSK